MAYHQRWVLLLKYLKISNKDGGHIKLTAIEKFETLGPEYLAAKFDIA